MTTRDRTVVMVLVLAGALAAFWFGLLAPKRTSATALKSKIALAQTRLQAAETSVTAGLAAERGYASDYATVARLGKAVPVDDDVPSLVYQLQSISHSTKIGFDSIELSSTAAPVVPAAAAPTTTAGQVAALGAAQKGQGTTTAPTTTPATTTPAAATPAAATTPAPATQSAAAGLPPGSLVGVAAFPTMPFDFLFAGDFFHLESFFNDLNKFTSADGSKIGVRGRLMTVDGFAISGFPDMVANVHATAYLLPDDQGLTAGATPQAPGATTTPASTTNSSSTTAPPVAAVTGVSP